MNTAKTPITYAFIDAANLFYGFEKQYGWSIDYRKLLAYLRTNYGVAETFYFGGVETHGYRHDYILEDTVNLAALGRYLEHPPKAQAHGATLNAADFALLSRHIKQVKFYQKLQNFGYKLVLKPVKSYFSSGRGRHERKKANCDVDLTLAVLREQTAYQRVLIISGDGDFLPVLKHVKRQGKDLIVMSRASRTAREIKRYAGPGLRDISQLRTKIQLSQLSK